MCTEKIGALSQLGAEKIEFPPYSDGRTDGHMVRRTGISNYRVASLLKMVGYYFYFKLVTNGI